MIFFARLLRPGAEQPFYIDHLCQMVGLFAHDCQDRAVFLGRTVPAQRDFHLTEDRRQRRPQLV